MNVLHTPTTANSAQSDAWLVQTWAQTSKGARVAWIGFALLIAAIYGAMALQQAYSSEYVVQDDARQHVFWMERLLDPGAFPNDLIADYFQSVAPYGFSALYGAAAALGIHPFVFNTFVPLLIGLATTFCMFRVALLLYPVPLAAFAATVMLNQSLWLRDDLATGIPRAFATLLLLGFIYYFMRRSLRGSLIMLVLQSMLYPHTLLISLGISGLGILRWRKWLPRFSRRRGDYVRFGACVLVGFLALLPFFLQTSDFGPTINATQARGMAEFQSDGRSYFFNDSAEKFWITGKRTGFLPRLNRNNPVIQLAWVFPLMLLLRVPPLTRTQIRRQWRVLTQITLASFVLFGAAHLLLFQLHLPSRYAQHSMLIVMNIAAGIVLAVLAQRLLKKAPKVIMPRWRGHSIFGVGLVFMLLVVLFFYPASRIYRDKVFPNANYITGTQPQLYEFFAAQPKDSLIASLSEEAALVMSFSARSALVSREHAIPYQLGYYLPFSQRVRDLIRAQYSPDLAELQNFIRRYEVDFLMFDRGTLTPGYLTTDPWVSQYQPEADAAASKLRAGHIPVVQKLEGVCSVFENDKIVVLDSRCILRNK